MGETFKSTKLLVVECSKDDLQSSVQISLGKSLRAKRARAFQNPPWKMQIFGSDLPPWVSVKPGTGQVHYLVIRDDVSATSWRYNQGIEIKMVWGPPSGLR